MRVGVLGLGEAGSLYAAGFLENGWSVTGYDPGDVPTPEGVERAGSIEAAVSGCDLVLGLTGAKAALAVAREAAPHLGSATVYADMNAAAPGLKGEIAQAVTASSKAVFADVSVIGSVPTYRHRTALVTSGPGAAVVADYFGTLGAPVEDLGSEPGAASARKLLRSVFMKGLGAIIVQTVEAGRAAGDETWVREQIASELAGGESTLERLYTGTAKHGVRRAFEVSAAADLMADLGLDAELARAISHVHQLAARPQGLRAIPQVTDELLAAHQDVATANIGDAVDRLALLDSGIRPLWPGARAIGRALTVWTRAGDNKAIHEAVRIAVPGDIIVVNGEGDTSRALIGELIAERAKARGVVGMVLDGAARDVDVLAEIGFPVWARAVTPAGPYKFGPGHVNVPVAVGGLVCRPGDLVVADSDGVAVVAAEKAGSVLDAARAVEADEAGRRARIRATAGGQATSGGES
ncbi:Regulator of ribonuclease activity A [Streptomyces sp. enrichment culture]|uniref:RraA family protein n=1 Tax=Streptomyces sp. enrichment culture TaxID=1795815 RepID=UPI003F549EA3